LEVLGVGGAWGWRCLGLEVPGVGGAWGWRCLGLEVLGVGGAWGWRCLGLEVPDCENRVRLCQDTLPYKNVIL